MPQAVIGKIKMNFEVKGSGEPIVLITGLGGDVSYWRGMVPLLSDKFKVITLDNRGSGLTECKNEPFDMEVLAEDVVKLLDHLSIPKAHILGWSMGGNIAQFIALNHPDRVATLTMISSYMRRPSRSSYMMNVMVDSVRSGGDLEYLYIIMQALCMTEELYQKMEAKKNYTTWKVNSDLDQFINQMAAVDGFDSRSWATKINAPTLVIHGIRDIMVPKYMSEELAAEIKGSKLVVIEGYGHTIPPKEYVKVFLEHIGKHPIL